MNFVDKDGTTKVYIPVHPCPQGRESEASEGAEPKKTIISLTQPKQQQPVSSERRAAKEHVIHLNTINWLDLWLTVPLGDLWQLDGFLVRY